MLSQVNLWVDRLGMLFDLVLMVRILALRLHRTYIFIALYAFLGLFYDGVGFYLGTDTPEFERVFLLSKFLYAAVYPLAIWDLFEEAKPLVEKVRKLAMTRMISSLLFISLWGVLIAAFTGGEDTDPSHYPLRVALVIWTGSIAASIAFLWVMRKGVRANNWQLPRNTAVWFRYFQLELWLEAVVCVMYLALPSIKDVAGGWVKPFEMAAGPIIQLCDVALIGWCVFKLRARPSDGADVTAKVNV